ncbi:HNH endonuclease [Rhodococcus ruber]
MPRTGRSGVVVVGEDLDVLAAICTTSGSCWIPRSSGRVTYRRSGDERPVDELPTLAPHRWAWAIAHGYTGDPGSQIHIRRRCGRKGCCNPEHLFATSTEGHELSDVVASALVERSEIRRGKKNDSGEVRIVGESLSDLAAIATIERGCWIVRGSGRVSVRFDGDPRPDCELPTFAPHRWAWSIAHGYMEDPGSQIHIRHRCGIKWCCNPDHLFPTTTNGRELSLSEVENLRQSSDTCFDGGRSVDKGRTAVPDVDDCKLTRAKRTWTPGEETGLGGDVPSSCNFAIGFRDPLFELLDE